MSISEKIDYLFSKINWADSPLDATAVEIMNSLKSEILEERQKQDAAFAELRTNYESLFDRISNGRSYLMEVEPNNLTVGDALEALGYGRNGLRYE